jgi:hypothetical protein
MTNAATESPEVYRLFIHYLPSEPELQLDRATNWTDLGVPVEKYFRQLIIELDTQHRPIDIIAEFDTGSSYTFANISTTRRLERFLSFPLDTLAKLVRLRFKPLAAFKLYTYKFDYLAETPDITAMQTDWESIGYAWDKILEAVVLEMDTRGNSVTVTIQRNGSTLAADSFVFTINVTGRQIVPLFLPRGTIGKTFRLVLQANTTVAFKYYRHQFRAKPEPPDATLVDTYETDMGYDRYKFIRRIWLAGKGANITVTVLADGVTVFTKTISFAVGVDGGWLKPLPLVLNAGVRGKLFRYLFSAPSAFKIYFPLSEVEWKPLGISRGYARFKMTAQTYQELQ